MRNQNSVVMAFSLLVIMSTLLMASRITAQLSGQQLPRLTDYSDEMLMSFIKAVREVMPLQQESQMKIIGEIENRDISISRFNSILESHTRGMDIDAPEEEMDAFNDAIEGIENVQLEYEEKIINAIESYNLTPEEYQGILADYQENSELQMRINALMEKMEADGDL